MLETDRDMTLSWSMNVALAAATSCRIGLRNVVARALDAPSTGCVQHGSPARARGDQPAAGTGSVLRVPRAHTAGAYSRSSKRAHVTVLVTGSIRYIGSRLVGELLKLGEPVGASVRDPARHL